MKKILLIEIPHTPMAQELQSIHRMLSILSVQTASVEKIPSIDDIFTPITEMGNQSCYKCLRIDGLNSHSGQSSSSHCVEGHEATIYAQYSGKNPI